MAPREARAWCSIMRIALNNPRTSRVEGGVRTAALLLVAACGRNETVPPSPPSPSPSAVESDAVPPSALLPCPVEQPSLGPGLTVERWPIDAVPAAGGPPCIDVVRADSTQFTLRVLSTGPDDPTPRNAETWQRAFHATAITNAGMFHETGKPVGLIVADGAARSRDNTKMGGYLAWDPVDANDPPITLVGRDCPGSDLTALRRRYHSILQSYRLLGCRGEALPWKDAKQYSSVAIGLDRAGRTVFLHARAAVTMSQLSIALAAHDLTGALFLEGGPEASLVAAGSDGELARVGSYETHFVENDGNHAFWDLPNVIALLPR